MKIVAVVVSLMIGMVIGGWLMLTTQDASPLTTTDTVPPLITATDEPTPLSSTTDRPPPAPRISPPTAPPPLSDQVMLVWTPGRLPDGLSDRVVDLPGVSAATPVRSGLVHITETIDATTKAAYRAPGRFVIPIETMAFDPATYPGLLSGRDAETFRELEPDEVLLGSTSARLRRLGPGGELVLEDESRLRVAAVVDDVVIGAAEAALPVATGERLGVDTARYLLIRYSGTREALEDAIRDELPDGLGVRIRTPGETPVLRHGDAVLPQVLIKETFGEFAYRRDPDLTFEVDSAWLEDSIVRSNVALLGTVRCHRNLLPALTGAMEELEKRNLGSLVQEFQGCFNPRFIAGGTGISRHAWGAAVDINIGSNPEGLDSFQDPRLIEVMERWGFTSGHEWLVPDPGHFEYVRPPD